MEPVEVSLASHYYCARAINVAQEGKLYESVTAMLPHLPMIDDDKRTAAEAAVVEIEAGMLVGLGTGSTAAFAKIGGSPILLQ